MAVSSQSAVLHDVFHHSHRGDLGRRFPSLVRKPRTNGREFLLAKQVQQMLLPQRWPQRGELECHRIYRPTQAVGGDYFDVLECDGGGTALVVADVSGHGLPAALLMANLQACFRSRQRCDFGALGNLVQSVNHSFYESSLPTFYATLFIATFDSALERIHYVNCGHNSPLLMFPELECPVRKAAFGSGDTLVVYTDGISDAEDPYGEPFGAERIAAAAWGARGLPISRVAEAVVREALRFSGGAQSDDMTVVVARSTGQ